MTIRLPVRLIGLAMCLATLPGLALNANASDAPLPIEGSVRLALDREPGETALRRQSQSLYQDATAAGQLADPSLRMGIVNLPSESFDFDKEAMTQFIVGLQQQFSPGSSRKAASAMLEATAAATAAQAEDRVRVVSLQARKDWLELYYWLHAKGTIDASRQLFAELTQITQSLYAVGQRDQHDVIRAQLELHRLDDRMLSVDEKVALSRADLGRWIGANADRPLSEALPDWNTLPISNSETQLQAHPLLQAHDQNIKRGEQDVALAASRYRPNWSLDFVYGFRGGEDPQMRPREDFISFVVKTELPFFTGKRQDRRLAAAHDRFAATVELREEQRRRLQRELERQLAHWQQLGERVDIFDELIVPESEMRSQAALLSYQSDKGDFTDVMRAYVGELDARLEHLRLQVDRLQAHAHVVYFLGEPS